jgi:uncharacterized RmlC-like cupin family protein
MVEEHGGCRIVRGGETFVGKQGPTYFAGISAETAGARGLCVHLLRFEPGERARAHLHEGHETAIYVLRGTATMWYGQRLEGRLAVSAGDFLYIPPGVPHLPANASDSEVCEALIARTDPNEQESVVLRPDLDGLAV